MSVGLISNQYDAEVIDIGTCWTRNKERTNLFKGIVGPMRT